MSDIPDFTALAAARNVDPELLGWSVDYLNIRDRTKYLLKAEGVHYIGELALKTESELIGTPNMGKLSCTEIKAALETIGLQLEVNKAPVPRASAPGGMKAGQKITRREQAMNIAQERLDRLKWTHDVAPDLEKAIMRQIKEAGCNTTLPAVSLSVRTLIRHLANQPGLLKLEG